MKWMLVNLILALCLLSPQTQVDTKPEDPHAEVRGMTISCHRAGRVWATDATVNAMAELKSLGVNWVCIHPYASIQADGSVSVGRMSRLYRDPTWLTRPIEEAHKLGLKIMIKPHIAYWGSPFDWRGEIHFDTENKWRRFFETYTEWITAVAEIASEADAFVVGTELDQTIDHTRQWRTIIAGVREQTNAVLTYSANWDQFRRVQFWDALDCIGIQSYFPIVDHSNLPSPAELEAGWEKLITRLNRYANEHNRTIILTELGYNRSSLAAVRPWAYRQGGPHAVLTQQRALNAALRAIENSDTIVGAFLWKWFPGEQDDRGNFLMSTPVIQKVIREHWKR